MEYITITDPGKTTFKVGEVVSREAFDKENERVRRLGESPATGRFSITGEKVWIRLGDVAEYESFDSSYDAGIEVAGRLGEAEKAWFEMRRKKPELMAFYFQPAGVAIPPSFVANNYISLFWGDKDAQWTRDLTNIEKGQFVEGVEKGILE